MSSNFLNLTPHKIIVRVANGDIAVEPSGSTARVATVENAAGELGGVPLVKRELGSVEIPVPDGFTGLVLVSSLVLEAAKAQSHPLLSRLAAPDTGPTAIRQAGQVVAVTRLVVA